MTQVITAVPSGDTAFRIRSLETGEEAVVVTQLVRRVDADTRVPCGAPVFRPATGYGTCANPKPDGAAHCWHHVQ